MTEYTGEQLMWMNKYGINPFPKGEVMADFGMTMEELLEHAKQPWPDISDTKDIRNIPSLIDLNEKLAHFTNEELATMLLDFMGMLCIRDIKRTYMTLDLFVRKIQPTVVREVLKEGADEIYKYLQEETEEEAEEELPEPNFYEADYPNL